MGVVYDGYGVSGRSLLCYASDLDLEYPWRSQRLQLLRVCGKGHQQALFLLSCLLFLSQNPGEHLFMSSLLRPSFLRRTLWGSLRQNTSPRHPLQATCRRAESTASAASNPGNTQYKAKKYSLLSPTMILLGFVPIFTFALGTWQVQRLKWKINLIDELEEKLQRDPLILPRHIKCDTIYSRSTLGS